MIRVHNKEGNTYSPTHYPLTSHYNPSLCVSSLAVFNHFLYSLQVWKILALRFDCLKPSLIVSNQHLFGWPRLLFSSTSKFKICPEYSSLSFTCLNQRSLLDLNTESKLFSFNQLRREFLLTRCSFMMFNIHNSIALSLCSKIFLFSCLRAQYSDE